MGTYDPPLEGREDENILLLDFNESTQPPSAAVMRALEVALQGGTLNHYPAYADMMEALSTYAGVPQQQIILTNGSDQALDITIRALLNEGDEMVFPQPGFAMIPQVADVQGAVTVSVPYREDMGFPYEEIMAAVTPRTRLIALINPNNPTGTAISSEQIEAILAAHRQVAVLVDEAYFEFTGETSIPLLATHHNLFITRTFSKAFALAGMRLGYVISNPEFISHLYKVRGPYDINALAITAARAALENPAPWKGYVEEVMTRAKPMVERFFEEHEVKFIPGAANFMLVRPDDRDGAFAWLRDNGILVRPQKPPIGDTFRLSVGTVEDMTRFMEVYSAYLSGPAALAREA
jgi:histidinol-phosphate aminotransferase